MKHMVVLGVVFLAGLPGSLLVGCASEEVPAATSTAPETSATSGADQLVGAWFARSPGDPDSEEVVGYMYGRVLEFGADGVVTYSSGLTPGSAEEVEAYWTYPYPDRDLLTWYGGEYCEEGEDYYPVTFADDRLTFGDNRAVSTGDEGWCWPELSGTAWSRESVWAPSTSTPQQWASVMTTQEAEVRPSLEALDDAIQATGAWVALQDAWDEAGYGQIEASVEEIQAAAAVVSVTASAMDDALAAAVADLGQPPDEVSALVDDALVASGEAAEAAPYLEVLDMCDTYDCSDSPSRLKEATEQLLRNFDSWAPYE